ncbi:hypothetical protein [Elizabethkingia meningoseptica]|uniref:hypothetical protein n=1 Tax=Elizabethkingia meningoseptica TaxID=238 RepID=UPI0023C0F356|nr:hypothetical protein [Elizabethkingia meningoseptica]
MATNAISWPRSSSPGTICTLLGSYKHTLPPICPLPRSRPCTAIGYVVVCGNCSISSHSPMMHRTRGDKTLFIGIGKMITVTRN